MESTRPYFGTRGTLVKSAQAPGAARLGRPALDQGDFNFLGRGG